MDNTFNGVVSCLEPMYNPSIIYNIFNYIMYKITAYSYKQAKKLGVTIKNSRNPKKKIDVFKNGKKVCSIGDPDYDNYPTHMLKRGKTFATKRRKMYRTRHTKDRFSGCGYYADKILW